jgi:hypothetical protein
VGEIPVIPLKVCGTVKKKIKPNLNILKYSYKPNIFTISHVNVFFVKENIKFRKFFVHMIYINRTVPIT